MLKIPLLTHDDELIPIYGTAQAAGADLRAHIPEQITLLPGEARLIPTGIKIELPSGFEVQIRPRSGLALKHGISVLNSPGTIDADYRGEIGVILINHGKVPFVIEPKMRIAQMVVAPCVQATFHRADALHETARGDGGFGSSGLR